MTEGGGGRVNKFKEWPIIGVYVLYFAAAAFTFHQLGTLYGFLVVLPLSYYVSRWTDKEYKRILAKRVKVEK